MHSSQGRVGTPWKFIIFNYHYHTRFTTIAEYPALDPLIPLIHTFSKSPLSTMLCHCKHDYALVPTRKSQWTGIELWILMCQMHKYIIMTFASPPCSTKGVCFSMRKQAAEDLQLEVHVYEHRDEHMMYFIPSTKWATGASSISLNRSFIFILTCWVFVISIGAEAAASSPSSDIV